MGKIWNEPVLLGAVVRTVVLAAVAFGWHLTDVQIASVMAVLEAVLALITRAVVTPNQLAEARVRQGGRPTVPRNLGVVLLIAALGGGIVAAPACANKQTAVQTVQVSHDSLALAQDLEARLCWNVASVFEGPENKSHCTGPLAGKVGLTDTLHQRINGKLAQAFTIHHSVTAQQAAGATNVDVSTLGNLITSILADLASLKDAPEVAQLRQAVEAGKVVK